MENPSHANGIDSPPDLPDGELTLDTLYYVLQNDRRRMALRHLRTTAETDLGTIADYVAARESGSESEAVSEEASASHRKRVYISLYQSHLPTLDEHGVVEFDQESNVVTPTSRLARFDAYLPGEPEDTIPAVGHVAAVGSIAAGVIVLAVEGLLGSSLAALGFLLVVTGLAGVTAAYAARKGVK